MPVTNVPYPPSQEVEALKARDKGAMEQLVRREMDRVYRCIARLVQDEDEARSLVQETFLQAFLKIDSFRGESKISTWLCAIGINLARAWLRKNKRLNVLSDQELMGLQPQFLDSGHGTAKYVPWQPAAFTEQNELKDIVHKAINKLPDDYRDVILLRDIEELPAQEVATMLDISYGALRVRLHRARSALRQLLDEYYQKSY